MVPLEWSAWTHNQPVLLSSIFHIPFQAHSVTSLPYKPFVIGLGYSPIPEKLVTKIKNGQFVDLADLLPKNVKVQDCEQPYQVWPTGPVWTVICRTFMPTYLSNNSTSHLPLHPHLLGRFFLCLFFRRSWNNGSCAWPYGQCRYRHHYDKCEGEHPSVNRPFWASMVYAQPSQSLTPPWSKCQRHGDRDQEAHFFSDKYINTVQLRRSFSP